MCQKYDENDISEIKDLFYIVKTFGMKSSSKER